MSTLDVAMRLRMINGLSGPARQAGQDIKSLGAAARALNGARGGEKLAADMRKIGVEAGRAAGRVADLNRKTGGLRAGLGMGARDAVVSSGFIPPVAFGMGSVGVAGAAAAGGTLAVIAGLKGAVSEAMKFEDAMGQVRKAVDTSPEALAKIENDILKISRITPLAKEEIAKLTAAAGFAGRPADELTRFGLFAAKAASAFEMSAEETGKKLAEFGNVWKLAQSGIEDTADAVNLMADNTSAREQDIIDFMSRVGPVAKMARLTSNQTAAFGASILSMGTTAEVAATGFNEFIGKIQAASKESDGFQKGLTVLGLRARTLEKDFAKNPIKTVLDVLERINKLDSAQQLPLLREMMGKEYADDVARMAVANKDLIGNLNLVTDAKKRAGSVERSYRIFDELTSSKVEKMKNSFAALGVHIGNALSPGVGAAADAVGGLLDKINTSIERTLAAEALAKKITKVGGLSKDDRSELRKDPALNREFQSNMAAKDHPIIGILQQQVELERELNRLDAPARQGDVGAQSRVFAIQAALNSLKGDMEVAMRVPGAAEAARQSMQAVAQAVASEGEEAVAMAQEIAARIMAAFNFQVSPIITPRIGPVEAPVGVRGTGTGPKAPEKQSSRSGGTNGASGGNTYAQHNTFHISGANPDAAARAVERRLARVGNSAGRLHDLA